jgi:hypothetical protein
VFLLTLNVQACKENLAAVEIVNLLIEEGAPLALKNRAGETPLDLIFKYVQNPVAVLQSKVFDEQIRVRYKFFKFISTIFKALVNKPTVKVALLIYFQVEFQGDSSGLSIEFDYSVLNPKVLYVFNLLLQSVFAFTFNFITACFQSLNLFESFKYCISFNHLMLVAS